MLDRAARSILAFIVFLTPTLGHSEEYTLQVGDTLDIAVPMVGLDRHMSVDINGNISVPLVGEIQAAGRKFSDVASYIRKEIPTKSYLMRSPGQRDSLTVIGPQEIILTISEYSPIYVMGDVSRPGAQKFRPGLTARQAISLAGGYDVVRFRIENPLLTSLDLKSDLRVACVDVIRYRARLRYFQDALKIARANTAPETRCALSPAEVDQITRSETATLAATADTYLGERDALYQSVSGLDGSVNTVTERSKVEKDNADLENSEVQRLTELYRAGTIPASRLADARRLGLTSALRAQSAAVQIEEEKRLLRNAGRDLQKLNNDRNEYLNSQLREAEDHLLKTTYKVASIREKLLYSSALQSQLLGKGATPKLVIFRKEDGKVREIDADEDLSLKPADVVEVRLPVSSEVSSSFN